LDVNAWCRTRLGSRVDEILFTAGHLSQVSGVRLADGREVVVKVRPASARLQACTDVQRALWQAGFPAPEPLVGPLTEGDPTDGDLAVSAEMLVAGGELAPDSAAVDRFAALLARFIELAPAADTVGSLEPNLPWVAFDHTGPGLWPAPDDRDVDLNASGRTTPWLNHVGTRVRTRLAKFSTPRVVIGHGDWEAQNLRWQGDQPLVVHDWDSIVRGPEATIVGQAASVWPCGIEIRAATVAESAAFIDAYQAASGRSWSTDETEASWAAGLWVYAFNTKKASLDNLPWLSPTEAEERLRLAGA
jgi:hypothetical protein